MMQCVSWYIRKMSHKVPFGEIVLVKKTLHTLDNDLLFKKF